MPSLGAADGQRDPKVRMHFLCLLNGWGWWMTEYDPEIREAFGFV